MPREPIMDTDDDRDDIELERGECDGCGQQYICQCCPTCGAPPREPHAPMCDEYDDL